MINLSSTLAHKYLKFKKRDRNISLMIKVCFLGIFVGTFSLMLTLIIMNGFEKTIHEKMQGINAQVVIFSPGNKLDNENIQIFLKKEFGNQIEGISGNSIRQVIIDKDRKQSVLFLKGIDPENESSVTNIAEKVVSLDTTPIGATRDERERVDNLLPQLLVENQILIGEKTAQNYNLKVGDKLNLLIPEPTGSKRIALRKKEAVISGIFKVGLEEYDNNFAFASLDFLQKIFKEQKGTDIISLKLNTQSNKVTFKDILTAGKQVIFDSGHRLAAIAKLGKLKLTYFKQIFLNIFMPQDEEAIIIKNIQKKVPMLTVHSWKDLYPALVASLKLEKYAMFFILALITLVACMSMVSLLFMYIQQKRRDIAIFKSMGLSNKKIRSIFLRIGLKITFWAATCGLGLAAIAGFILEKYPFIQLPDVYYISYLPARMEPEIFIVVFVATMLLGFFATWIPAQRTKHINISQVLRQE